MGSANIDGMHNLCYRKQHISLSALPEFLTDRKVLVNTANTCGMVPVLVKVGAFIAVEQGEIVV